MSGGESRSDAQGQSKSRGEGETLPEAGSGDGRERGGESTKGVRRGRKRMGEPIEKHFEMHSLNLPCLVRCSIGIGAADGFAKAHELLGRDFAVAEKGE